MPSLGIYFMQHSTLLLVWYCQHYPVNIWDCLVLSPALSHDISLYCVLHGSRILLCLDGYILTPAYLKRSYMPHFSCYVVSYRQTKVLIHYKILAGIICFIAETDLSLATTYHGLFEALIWLSLLYYSSYSLSLLFSHFGWLSPYLDCYYLLAVIIGDPPPQILWLQRLSLIMEFGLLLPLCM